MNMIHLTVFYNSLGLVGSLLILAYCLVQVFDKRVDDGVVGRLLYLSIATCCIAALIHMVQGVHPPRTVNTLLVFVGLAMCRRMVMLSPWWAHVRSRYTLMVKQAKAHNRSK